MKLYGISMSPYVRKVAAVMNLKGIDYEREDSFPGTVPRELSPLGKIPALVDGEVSLCDSSVICEYLEERYPEVQALPKSPVDRARSRWLEEFADSKLSELCGGGIFFERVVKGLLHKQPADEAKVANTITNLLPPVLDYLESQLPADGFLFGRFGIADISIVTQFINAGYANYHVDAARWPRITAFIERVSKHPAMQKQLQLDAGMMAAMGLVQ